MHRKSFATRVAGPSKKRAWPARGCRVLIAEARMPSREGRRSRRPPSRGAVGGGLFDLSDGPAKGGQFARDGDRDQGAALAAAFHPPPGPMQASVGRSS